MRRYSFLLVFFWTIQSHSVTVKEVGDTYRHIIFINGYKNPPALLYNKLDNTMNAAYIPAINSIIWNKGATKFVKNKEEVAWILGHELGHWENKNGSTWKTEMAADKSGVAISKRAGYNGCKGAKLLVRFGKESDKYHPSGVNRWKSLKKGVCK